MLQLKEDSYGVTPKANFNHRQVRYQTYITLVSNPLQSMLAMLTG